MWLCMCPSALRFPGIATGAFLFFTNLAGQILKCGFCVLKTIFSQINKHSSGPTRHVSSEAFTRTAGVGTDRAGLPPLPQNGLSNFSPPFSFWKALHTPACFSAAQRRTLPNCLRNPRNTVQVLKSSWLQMRGSGVARSSVWTAAVLSPPFTPPSPGHLVPDGGTPAHLAGAK